jgi:uncharacterized protein YuzE
MSITIANTTFNNVRYDAAGDVLYLNVGDPADAVTFDDTPEGHNVGSNATGEIVAVALLHPRWLLEQEGKVAITLPSRVEVSADTLDQALVAAA